MQNPTAIEDKGNRHLTQVLTGDSHKWRFRELLAMQLPVLCGLFSPVATFSVVSKILFELLFDPVKTVQAHAFEVGERECCGKGECEG